MRYKQPLSHSEIYDCNFQTHNLLQLKMPKDLQEDDGTSLNINTNKINHRPICLHLCLEIHSSQTRKLHKKTLSGQRGLFIHLYCLSLRQQKYIFYLGNIKIDKIKLFNLLLQR